MSNKQIAVVGINPFVVPSDPMYFGLQVGNAPDIPHMQRDNTGDNISSKNSSYCELTAQYWMWKNSDADIKGLMHYRRILGRRGSSAVPFESMDARRAKAVTEKEVSQLLEEYDIILPRAHNYLTETAREHYEKTHVTGFGFDLLKDYFAKNSPQYLPALEHVLNSRESHLFNMFIAKKDIFDVYSAWLFPALEYVESKIDISMLSPYEQRIYGYLSELLLDVWIQTNKLRYIELPMLFLARQNLPKRYATGLAKKLGLINPAADERKRIQNENHHE